MKKIHLIRTEEVDEEVYASIVQFLKQFKGPMEFFGYDESFSLDARHVKVIKKTDEDFAQIQPPPMAFEESISLSRTSSYMLDPPLIKAYEWNKFFDVAEKFRKLKKVSPEDHVFVFTYKGNKQNWFVGSQRGGIKNYFIHLVYWEHFILSEPTFPVAYHVASSVLKREAWGSLEDFLPYTHDQPRGCISDMCWDKRDIVLKLRTADLCPDCWEKIVNSSVDRFLLNQVLKIFDSVRTQLLFRERHKRLGDLSEMKVISDKLTLVFTSLGNLKVKLSPIEFAVYLFFLKHPQGILLSHLSDYQFELMELYSISSGDTDAHAIQARVNEICNPLSNSISEKLSKIKSKLTNLLGEELAQHYIISGPNGGLKKISASRENITGLN